MENNTYRRIQNAFLELLGQMPLNKITVSKITAKCGNTRNAFYYYADSILSLLTDIVTTHAYEIIRENPGIEDLENMLQATVALILAHRHEVKNIFADNSYTLQSWLFQVCHCITEYYFTTTFYPVHLSADLLQPLVRFTGNLLVAFMLDWGSQGFTDQICLQIPGLCNLLRADLTCFRLNAQDISLGQSL